jgi:NAD(P)H-flavin reductase
MTALALDVEPDVAPVAAVEGSRMRLATVRRIVPEAAGTATYWLAFDDAADRSSYSFEPGQFNMVTVAGAGEVPISLSSDPARRDRLGHTVRVAGRVTSAFPALQRGDRVGIRGPFGTAWPMRAAAGGDLVVVAGGLGLAPVRPAVYRALANRQAFRRVVLLVGARDPANMLFRAELDAWAGSMRSRGVEVALTVDVPSDDWPYGAGVVTTLFPAARLDPARSTVFVCGPEPMMRFAARDLLGLGIGTERIHLSMERNMQCGVRLCGHCQLGPRFVCTDGPVFRLDDIADLLEVDQV